MKNHTLARQLFLRIAPVILLAIAAVSGLAFYSARGEINFEYDAQLINNANVLWVLVEDELSEPQQNFPRKIEDIDVNINGETELNDTADDYADSRMFRVWKAGKLVMHSDTAMPGSSPRNPPGFSMLNYLNEEWVIYTLPIPETDIAIEVGEKKRLREILALDILLNLAMPMLLLIPAIGGLIWFGINRGLGAIRLLVDQILRRTPDDLSHVNVTALPEDLSPLGEALNQLFGKLENSFAAEKRFTDHAAHQLRTPQATIKLQLQMLAAATSDAEKEELVKELIQSNDRATKLIAMLLTSARLNHQPVNLQPVAAYPATAAVMAELGVLAKRKAVEMSLEGTQDVTVVADEALFKLMMENIIENAIKYTPANGAVRVTIEPGGKACKISVCDTGCGIPEEERELVFGRFYRISTPQQEGCGLGLALVAEVIARFSGDIALKTPASGIGLLVEVELPVK